MGRRECKEEEERRKSNARVKKIQSISQPSPTLYKNLALVTLVVNL